MWARNAELARSIGVACVRTESEGDQAKVRQMRDILMLGVLELKKMFFVQSSRRGRVRRLFLNDRARVIPASASNHGSTVCTAHALHSIDSDQQQLSNTGYGM